jgi:site-specific DNA-methyltransferase (adenine-specific)
MINLYNRDCMEAMKEYPDKHFNLAIVDPPYGLGLKMITHVDQNKRNGRNSHNVVKHEQKNWNDEIPSPEYFEEIHRVSIHQIIWGCNYYAKYIPATGRIVHDKMMGTENTAFNWSHADLASCSLFQRIVMFRYQWAGNKQGGKINWKNEGGDARIHPTQKPIALYKWLLKNYANTGDKILDTHLGSGSIAIACHELGFALTGFEIDKDYYDAACRRLKDHQSQLRIAL